MSTKNQQRLAYGMVLAYAGIFADAMARGIDSLFGRFFVWLCAQ